jgi:hypothetical protein
MEAGYIASDCLMASLKPRHASFAHTARRPGMSTRTAPSLFAARWAGGKYVDAKGGAPFETCFRDLNVKAWQLERESARLERERVTERVTVTQSMSAIPHSGPYDLAPNVGLYPPATRAAASRFQNGYILLSEKNNPW